MDYGNVWSNVHVSVMFRLSSPLSLCAASNLQVGEDVGKYKHLKLQRRMCKILLSGAFIGFYWAVTIVAQNFMATANTFYLEPEWAIDI